MQAANKNLEAGAKWIAALTSHGSKGLSPRSKAMLQHGAGYYCIYAQTGDEQYRELCGSYIHSALRVDGAAKIYVAEKKTSAIQMVLIAVAMLALALLTACGATNPTYEVLGVRVYNNTDGVIPRDAMREALLFWADSYAEWAGIAYTKSDEFLVQLRSISILPPDGWADGNKAWGSVELQTGKIWIHWRGCTGMAVLFHELMHFWLWSSTGRADALHMDDAAWGPGDELYGGQVGYAYLRHEEAFCAAIEKETNIMVISAGP